MVVKPEIKIVVRDERIEAYRGNNLVAYVENDTLYGFRDGYAEKIGPVNHRSEIAGKWRAWSER